MFSDSVFNTQKFSICNWAITWKLTEFIIETSVPAGGVGGGGVEGVL